MTWLTKILREPLVHFVAAGAVLFTAHLVLRGPEAIVDDESTIVVDRAALLTFMQYRANAFEAGTFGGLLDGMSEEERARLIDAYVEEEILHREARALGLEESDYVIRQRMIQKMRYLLGDVAGAGAEVDEEALAAYFAANQEAYAVAPSVTFTHVFLDAERRGQEGARVAAEEVLAQLAADGAGFNDAPGYSDRFPYLVNYVERTFEYVASQFGTRFAAELANLSPADATWQGPIASDFGQHLVLLTSRTETRLPELDEVRSRVEDDFRREGARTSLDEAIAAIKTRYRVEVDDLAAEAQP